MRISSTASSPTKSGSSTLRITSQPVATRADSSPLFLESASNKILDALPAAERALVWGIGEEISVSRGQVIARSNQPLSHVYFPQSAVFSMMTNFATGHSVESGTVGNEGFVGLAVLLGAGSCPQRTMSQIRGTACRVTSEEFMNLLPQLPTLSNILNRYLLAYIAQISQSSACNIQHTVAQRCARWILLTQDRVGANRIPLTQEFLAYMLGVRRPSVTVSQAAMQRKGLIRYTRGRLDVLDRHGLEKESCECYQAVRREFESLLGGPRAG